MTPALFGTMKNTGATALSVLLIALVGSCSSNPLSPRATQGQTLVVPVGQDFSIELGAAGTYQYFGTPTILQALPVVRFIGDTAVCPCPPGAFGQVFRFKGALLGKAIVVFQGTGGLPVVGDTVIVR